MEGYDRNPNKTYNEKQFSLVSPPNIYLFICLWLLLQL